MRGWIWSFHFRKKLDEFKKKKIGAIFFNVFSISCKPQRYTSGADSRNCNYCYSEVNTTFSLIFSRHHPFNLWHNPPTQPFWALFAGFDHYHKKKTMNNTEILLRLGMKRCSSLIHQQKLERLEEFQWEGGKKTLHLHLIGYTFKF